VKYKSDTNLIDWSLLDVVFQKSNMRLKKENSNLCGLPSRALGLFLPFGMLHARKVLVRKFSGLVNNNARLLD